MSSSTRTNSDPLRINVNADDLSMSAEVNPAIADWVEQGIVTSVTAMGNGPAQDKTVAGSLSALGVSIGVHCNLSEFSPLTVSDDLAPLLKPDGSFDAVARRVDATPALRQAVTTELRAQIDAVAALGVTPSHLDSHHHDHFVGWLMRVYRQLRISTGIHRVRSPLSNNEIGGAKAKFVRSRARDAQRYVFGFTTPDQFVDLAYLGKQGTIDELRSMRGIIEVMTHPGHPSDGELEAGQLLRDADWVDLVDYRAL